MNILKNLSGWRKRKVPPHYINEIRLTKIIGDSALTHQLYIRSGEFEFTGNFDNNLHNFYDVVGTAIKFFGVKYGLITLDEEGNARPTKKGMN